MGNLFKAFLFRLRRDLTFRITLFIGIGLAVFTVLLYVVLEIIMNKNVPVEDQYRMLSGQSMLVMSLSPAQAHTILPCEDGYLPQPEKYSASLQFPPLSCPAFA